MHPCAFVALRRKHPKCVFGSKGECDLLDPVKEQAHAADVFAALRAGKPARLSLLIVLRNSLVVVPEDICTAQRLPIGSSVAQLAQHLRKPTPKPSATTVKATACPVTQA